MKRAFTLIELLVVIAIIAILAAILFPVFAQAKAAAKKVQSLSNAKNIGLGAQMYCIDVDDRLPTLQDQPLGGVWIGWPEKFYPYIKNGNKNGTFARDGIYRAPGDATTQENGSYAMHQDIARDGAAPWNGYASPTVFSTTQIDGLSDKIYLFERGNNNGWANWLQFTPWEWDWVDWVNFDRATGQPRQGPGTYVSLNTGKGDCDLAFNATNYTSFDWSWALCGMLPRYRYSSATPAVFLDGHAKSFSRTSRATTMDWFKNIYIKEAAQYDASWYPY